MKTEDNENLELINENRKETLRTVEKQLRDEFFEQMTKINYFEQLSAIKGKLHEFNVNIKVSGLDELNGLAGDILKICIYALQMESGYGSQIGHNSKLNILSLLELALQLMPDNLEILDELHQTQLKIKDLKV